MLVVTGESRFRPDKLWAEEKTPFCESKRTEPPSCSNTECWALQCTVGLLEKGTTAILKVRSRIWAETFTEVVTSVVWNKPETEYSVPLWIIILAILAG